MNCNYHCQLHRYYSCHSKQIELCDTEPQAHIPFPYFYNDTVYRFSSTGIEFGHVLYPLHLPSDTDLETLLLQGFNTPLPIYWTQSKVIQSHPPDDPQVHLQSREFLPGMRARKKYSDTYGRVFTVQTACTVRILETQQLISHVPSHNLLPLKPVQVANYVQIKDWIGVVTSIQWQACFNIFDNLMHCSYTWEENAESSSGSTKTKNPFLGDHIHYVGQHVHFSSAQVLFELQWPSYNFLLAQLKALRSDELIGTVISLTPTYHIEWLNRIPSGSHQQFPKPPTTCPDSDPDLHVFPNSSLGPTLEIDAYYKLSADNQTNWQFTSFDEWQNGFRPQEPSVKPPPAPSNRESAVQIWNQLRNVSSFPQLDNELTVQLLSMENWVMLIDPNTGNNVSYVNSVHLEPILLAQLPTFPPLGSVVTLPESGLPPSFYGVVTGFNDSNSRIRLNWFRLQHNAVTFLGPAESLPEGVAPHPLFTLTPGQILFSPKPIPPLHNLVTFTGVFEKVGLDGLLHVRHTTTNRIHKYLPHSLKPFPWMYAYNCSEKVWKLSHTGSQRHLGETPHPSPSINFRPSSSVIAKTDSNPFPTLSEFEKTLEYHPSMQSAVISDVLWEPDHSFTSLVSDLRKYTGEPKPNIHLKFGQSNTLHAVIQGPNQSLYQDFLLFFTIQLPPNYPTDPPIFKYHSFSPGLVNPCLLTNGQVLFPLLNTYPKFPGLYQENWDSGEHSLGLVLASIQKILLCSIPYQHDRKFPLLKLISSSVSQHRCLAANLIYMENIIDSLQNQLESPLPEWRFETLNFYRIHLPRFYNRATTSLRDCESNKCLTSIPLPRITKKKQTLLQNKLNHLRYLYTQLM